LSGLKIDRRFFLSFYRIGYSKLLSYSSSRKFYDSLYFACPRVLTRITVVFIRLEITPQEIKTGCSVVVFFFATHCKISVKAVSKQQAVLIELIDVLPNEEKIMKTLLPNLSFPTFLSSPWLKRYLYSYSFSRNIFARHINVYRNR
jgi:hypothetical protein